MDLNDDVFMLHLLIDDLSSLILRRMFCSGWEFKHLRGVFACVPHSVGVN